MTTTLHPSIPFLDLQAQYRSIKDEVDAAVASVLASAHFVLGPEVDAFETEFAAYCESAHCIGVNSGTSALHLALLAAGVGPGDEVVTVSHTFVATVAAIRYTGASPVFVDVRADSSTMDPEQLERVITPRTRAVIPVHLYGQCADMDPICEIARAHGLVVVEDAAQAHGAFYRGRRAGSIGEMACFSFYPGKNLGAYGEGGAVVTSDPELAARIRVLRDHGQTRKYQHEVLGYNHRLEALQAAVLRVKLRRLDGWNADRRRVADAYRRNLQGAGVRLAHDMAYGEPVHHVFPIFTPDRERLRVELAESGIAASIHYPIPVHMQPAFADLGLGAGALPVSERLAAETLSLPMYPELDEEDVRRVAGAVRRLSARG